LFGADFGLEFFDGGGQRHGAFVAFDAVANGDGAGFGVFGADDEHVRDELQLGIADFGAEFFGPIVAGDAQPSRFQFRLDTAAVLFALFAYRQHANLFRSEPEWKRPGEVFDEDTDEAFQRA